jgi:hypothetical protein
MQKISSYLYPNRIQLLADLAGFTVEYTNVYQRTVKIYNGIDNTLEFDIKNADQKRINLSTLTNIVLNVMDASGNALPNSPYTVSPLDQSTLKGLAKVTIPQEDLIDLSDQYLTYSVTANKDGDDVILYGDSRFGATGKMELIGNAMPTFRDDRVYDSFTGDIDLKGAPTWHSSAIPSKFYEAVASETLDFEISITNFVGSVWIEATKRTTINTEAFKGAVFLWSTTFPAEAPGNGQIGPPSGLPIGDYQYFRVSYTSPMMNGVGANFNITRQNSAYTVDIRNGGTNYQVGSQIKVLGSAVGGTDGINDVLITVTNIDASSAGYTSSYAASAMTNIVWSGTAAAGHATYVVTGTNVSGTVDKVTVS